jgi:hypothetical protein
MKKKETTKASQEAIRHEALKQLIDANFEQYEAVFKALALL